MTHKQFIQALRNGPYAWPGGYPVTVFMQDGALICFKCARQHALQIARSTRDNGRDGWAAAAVDVKWENDPETGPEQCEQCCEEIEVAYPDSE